MEEKLKLTVLLSIKGRNAHTARYLWHAHRTEFPYAIRLIDGDATDRFASLFANLRARGWAPPQAKYSYHGPDHSTLRYYGKMLEAMKDIDSEYVVINDNDDFPSASGLRKSVEFLETNPEFVGAGGRVGGFRLRDESGKTEGVWGSVQTWSALAGRIAYRPVRFAHEKVSDRLEAQMLQNRSAFLFYYVYRKSALERVLSEMHEAAIQDFTLMELYFVQRMLSLGKVEASDGFYVYYRQRGTSQFAVNQGSWQKAVFFQNWMGQFDSYLRFLAERVAQLAGMSPAAFSEWMKAFFVKTEFPKVVAPREKRVWLARVRNLTMTLENRFRLRERSRLYACLANMIVTHFTKWELGARGAGRDFFEERKSVIETLGGNPKLGSFLASSKESGSA